MKKGLIFVLGILSFLGINTVSADTTLLSNYYDYYEDYINDYYQYKDNIDFMINYWEENYSSDYPYYAIIEHLNGLYTYSTGPVFRLFVLKNNKVLHASELTVKASAVITFNTDTNEYYYDDISSLYYDGDLLYLGTKSTYQEYNLLISNGLVCDFNTVHIIPTYFSQSLNLTLSEIKLKKGINYPGLIELKDGTYDYNPEDAIVSDFELESIFSNPLEFLNDAKDAIVNMFTIIAEFISLLPPIMQGFLLTSFSTIIILGIIKILL